MTAVTARAAAPIRWRLTWATARRALTQLRHDPRTVVMLIAVPSVLMILLRYVLDSPLALNRFAPEFISAGASWSGAVNRDVGIILGFTVCALAGGALTLRRRTR
jgi:hypothetical protein